MSRLDKVLSEKGFGTRKEVKKIIKDKLVMVNDNIITKDDFKVSVGDTISVDESQFIYEEFVYIMLNKPQGVISATEDERHQTVLDCISDKTKGLFPVGRLDIDTEGLCFISNDGKLAHRLLSPNRKCYKTYYVEISVPLTKDNIISLENGITIGDEVCKPAIVEIIDETRLHLSIMEGKYHQVKRMMLACGSEVTYLKRLTIGSLTLDNQLQCGQWRYLTLEEIEQLSQ